MASTNWQDGISPWDFSLSGGAQAQPYVGYVYTDRPIYRPGQTVYWKAIIRRDNDASYSLPAPGQPVTVTINDDQGNVLVQQTPNPGRSGRDRRQARSWARTHPWAITTYRCD